jgi:mersacidin/lichenicidin family type 2 lantibiotic
MTQAQVVRAWKDPEYRSTLSEAQLRALPANPAGLVELNESELMEVNGGTTGPCAVSVIVTLTLLLRSDTPKEGTADA